MITLPILSALHRSGLRSGSVLATIKANMLETPRGAFVWADKVVHGRCVECEPIIAPSAQFSYYYAELVLLAPFPAGEPALLKDGQWAENYALDPDAMGRRWPEAEPAIFGPGNNPSSYFNEFFDRSDAANYPDCVNQYLIRVNGACDYCGDPLSGSQRDTWSDDEENNYCSGECAQEGIDRRRKDFEEEEEAWE